MTMRMLILATLILGGIGQARARISYDGNCQSNLIKAENLIMEASRQERRFRRALLSKDYESGSIALEQARDYLIRSNFALRGVMGDQRDHCSSQRPIVLQKLEQNENLLDKIDCHSTVTDANIAFLKLSNSQNLDAKKGYVKQLRAVETNQNCLPSLRKQARINLDRYLNI